MKGQIKTHESLSEIFSLLPGIKVLSCWTKSSHYESYEMHSLLNFKNWDWKIRKHFNHVIIICNWFPYNDSKICDIDHFFQSFRYSHNRRQPAAIHIWQAKRRYSDFGPYRHDLGVSAEDYQHAVPIAVEICNIFPLLVRIFTFSECLSSDRQRVGVTFHSLESDLKLMQIILIGRTRTFSFGGIQETREEM